MEGKQTVDVGKEKGLLKSVLFQGNYNYIEKFGGFNS